MYCVNKSKIVVDQTIAAEGSDDFFKQLGKAAKKVGKNVNNPGEHLNLHITETVAASSFPKLIAAITPEVKHFIYQGKG